MPLLASVLHKRKGAVAAHFHQELQYTDKFVYKALTLYGKQLFLRRHQPRSHKSAV